MDGTAVSSGVITLETAVVDRPRARNELDGATIEDCFVREEVTVLDGRCTTTHVDRSAEIDGIRGEDACLDDRGGVLAEECATLVRSELLVGGADGSVPDREATQDGSLTLGGIEGDQRSVESREIAVDHGLVRSVRRFDRDRLAGEVDRFVVGSGTHQDQRGISRRCVLDRFLDRGVFTRHLEDAIEATRLVAEVGDAIFVLVGEGAVKDLSEVDDAVLVAVGGPFGDVGDRLGGEVVPEPFDWCIGSGSTEGEVVLPTGIAGVVLAPVGEVPGFARDPGPSAVGFTEVGTRGVLEASEPWPEVSIPRFTSARDVFEDPVVLRLRGQRGKVSACRFRGISRCLPVRTQQLDDVPVSVATVLDAPLDRSRAGILAGRRDAVVRAFVEGSVDLIRGVVTDPGSIDLKWIAVKVGDAAADTIGRIVSCDRAAFDDGASAGGPAPAHAAAAGLCDVAGDRGVTQDGRAVEHVDPAAVPSREVVVDRALVEQAVGCERELDAAAVEVSDIAVDRAVGEGGRASAEVEPAAEVCSVEGDDAVLDRGGGGFAVDAAAAGVAIEGGSGGAVAHGEPTKNGTGAFAVDEADEGARKSVDELPVDLGVLGSVDGFDGDRLAGEVDGLEVDAGSDGDGHAFGGGVDRGLDRREVTGHRDRHHVLGEDDAHVESGRDHRDLVKNLGHFALTPVVVSPADHLARGELDHDEVRPDAHRLDRIFRGADADWDITLALGVVTPAFDRAVLEPRHVEAQP